MQEFSMFQMNNSIFDQNKENIKTSTSEIITSEQLKILKFQIAAHFQQLLQMIILTKEESSKPQILDSTIQLFNDWKTTYEVRKKTFEDSKSTSILDIPQMSLLVSSKKSNIPFSSLDFTKETLRTFEPYFFLHLKPNLNSISSSQLKQKFTPAEDRLLLIGLFRYGIAWEQIKKEYFPTKTSLQLKNRYKNMNHNPSDNLFKHYQQQRKVPLTLEETNLLIKGALNFGLNFELISKHLLPQKYPSILRYWYQSLPQPPIKFPMKKDMKKRKRDTKSINEKFLIEKLPKSKRRKKVNDVYYESNSFNPF